MRNDCSNLTYEKCIELEKLLSEQERMNVIHLETSIRLLLIDSIEMAMNAGYKIAYEEMQPKPSKGESFAALTPEEKRMWAEGKKAQHMQGFDLTKKDERNSY